MALSDDAKWMDLERFSKSKKPPPIGFEVCILFYFSLMSLWCIYT